MYSAWSNRVPRPVVPQELAILIIGSATESPRSIKPRRGHLLLLRVLAVSKILTQSFLLFSPVGRTCAVGERRLAR